MSNFHCFHFLSGCLFQEEETEFFCFNVRAAHTCLAFSLMLTSHYECHIVKAKNKWFSFMLVHKSLPLILMYGSAVMLLGWSNPWWGLFAVYYLCLWAYGCLCVCVCVCEFFSHVSVCARFNVCLVAFHVCFYICMLTCNVFQYVHAHFLCVFHYVLLNCGGGGWSLVARELQSSPALLPCCLTAWCTCAPSYLPVPLYL